MVSASIFVNYEDHKALTDTPNCKVSLDFPLVDPLQMVQKCQPFKLCINGLQTVWTSGQIKWKRKWFKLCTSVYTRKQLEPYF
jgi:hypothetical protein